MPISTVSALTKVAVILDDTRGTREAVFSQAVAEASVAVAVKPVAETVAGGLRSGMTYLNAQSIADITKNARFMEMSSSGMIESKPHGMH